MIHCYHDINFDETCIFCISILFDDRFYIQLVCYTLHGFDEYITNEWKKETHRYSGHATATSLQVLCLHEVLVYPLPYRWQTKVVLLHNPNQHLFAGHAVETRIIVGLSFWNPGFDPVFDTVIVGQRFFRASPTADSNTLSSRQRCYIKITNYNVKNSFILTVVVCWGYAVVQLVEATSRKVASSIPDGFTGIWHNPSWLSL